MTTQDQDKVSYRVWTSLPLADYPLPLMLVEEEDCTMVLSMIIAKKDHDARFIVHTIGGDTEEGACVFELERDTPAEDWLLTMAGRPGARMLFDLSALSYLHNQGPLESVDLMRQALTYAVGMHAERRYPRSLR